MKINANPVRGTKDYLPTEAALREYVRSKIAATYKSYGFRMISTPMMEDIERLNKSDGGENLAMIFKLLKRGQKLDLEKENLTEDDLVDSGLRYDLTMPLSRYFANNRQFLPLPFKSIQIDKVFRAERPQKGRLREFYQCDIDIIGDSSVTAEMELIAATTDALSAIGFTDFTLRINDRRLLTDMILAAGFKEEDTPSVCITFDKLDKIGLDGVKEELISKEYSAENISRFLEIVGEAEKDAMAAAEKFVREPEVLENLRRVLDFANDVADKRYTAVYDPSLTRGMGYYTGMVFEIVSPKFGSSVAGGGRYDEMVGKFLGEKVPAVGFSIGFERVCEILKDEQKAYQEPDKIIIIYDETTDSVELFDKAKEFRLMGLYTTFLKRSKKLAKQIDALIEDGYTYSYTMGGEVDAPKKLTAKAKK